MVDASTPRRDGRREHRASIAVASRLSDNALDVHAVQSCAWQVQLSSSQDAQLHKVRVRDTVYGRQEYQRHLCRLRRPTERASEGYRSDRQYRSRSSGGERERGQVRQPTPRHCDRAARRFEPRQANVAGNRLERSRASLARRTRCKVRFQHGKFELGCLVVQPQRHQLRRARTTDRHEARVVHDLWDAEAGS